ncbi:putative transcriptional regulator [Nitratireductor aquibiodomus RA22]|uniref:Putative transcriptional regulator n=1 Tax=Nitratireductor aquibiodomus RA22 TaxID=1189611 RepID=I5C576_9HYPH|nr:Lrp/AsnC family transcriptional regulator [Nitratireductor aquibiodomus]EIM76978.1 putative transcriptional regulator [Nitratireductor aquibiodomus RA22]
MSIHPINIQTPGASVKIDRIDLRILTELQKNGRITNFKLSSLVGISPSPCHKRVRRLEKMGLISGYAAHVAWTRLYPSVSIFASVSLKNHTAADFQLFERSIKRYPEITNCFGLCGPYDYILRFDCKDMVVYEAISRELLEGEVQLSRFDSYVVLREIKNEPISPTAWN